MGHPEGKSRHGQNLDELKSGIVLPALVEIFAQIPNLPNHFAMIDIGSGDGSSAAALTENLRAADYQLSNLALVDADIKVVPPQIQEATTGKFDNADVQVVHSLDSAVINLFLSQSEGKFDVALLQLVLHQMPETKAAYLVYCAHRALKEHGELLVTTLHPAYLQYLSKNHPDKFAVSVDQGDRLVGDYHFDSGGSVTVYGNSIQTLRLMFLSLGFDIVSMAPLMTGELADLKPRYRELADNNIPMFCLFQLRKNPERFVSSTEGIVNSVERLDEVYLKIVFIDDQFIIIPKINSWEERIKTGSRFIIHETQPPNQLNRILHYWIIGEDSSVDGAFMTVMK